MTLLRTTTVFCRVPQSIPPLARRQTAPLRWSFLRWPGYFTRTSWALRSVSGLVPRAVLPPGGLSGMWVAATGCRQPPGRPAPPLNDRVRSMRRALACGQGPRLSGVSAHLQAGFSDWPKALEAPDMILLPSLWRNEVRVVSRFTRRRTGHHAEFVHSSPEPRKSGLKRPSPQDRARNQQHESHRRSLFKSHLQLLLNFQKTRS